jgi:ABC-type sulfate transport system substrate-binding protein
LITNPQSFGWLTHGAGAAKQIRQNESRQDDQYKSFHFGCRKSSYSREYTVCAMKTIWLNTLALVAVACAAALIVVGNTDRHKSSELLNVSYDPTRELFIDLNRQFVAQYANDTGRRLTIKQSHGGSGRQARAVIDGLAADVVTLALPTDVDMLRKQRLIADGWAKELPHDSAPWTSTIVFVVRRGNPLRIRDWPDLVRPGVSVITPNPKTSGNGKLSLLGAWGSVICRGGSEKQASDYLRRLYQHVVVLDTGARGSTITFAGEEMGDVHLILGERGVARSWGLQRRLGNRLSAGQHSGGAQRRVGGQ